MRAAPLPVDLAVGVTGLAGRAFGFRGDVHSTTSAHRSTVVVVDKRTVEYTLRPLAAVTHGDTLRVSTAAWTTFLTGLTKA